jgi:hypothetical protein
MREAAADVIRPAPFDTLFIFISLCSAQASLPCWNKFEAGAIKNLGLQLDSPKALFFQIVSMWTAGSMPGRRRPSWPKPSLSTGNPNSSAVTTALNSCWRGHSWLTSDPKIDTLYIDRKRHPKHPLKRVAKL